MSNVLAAKAFKRLRMTLWSRGIISLCALFPIGGHSVIGTGSSSNSCFATHPMIYDLHCHQWKALDKRLVGVTNHQLCEMSTRYGHAAARGQNGTVFLAGGFDNILLGDMIAVRFLEEIVDQDAGCTALLKKRDCVLDRRCVWCPGVSSASSRCTSRFAASDDCLAKPVTTIESVCTSTCRVSDTCGSNSSQYVCRVCTDSCLPVDQADVCLKPGPEAACVPPCKTIGVTRLYSNHGNPNQPVEVEHSSEAWSNFESMTSKRRYNQVILLGRIYYNCLPSEPSKDSVDATSCSGRKPYVAIKMHSAFGWVKAGSSLDSMVSVALITLLNSSVSV